MCGCAGVVVIREPQGVWSAPGASRLFSPLYFTSVIYSGQLNQSGFPLPIAPKIAKKQAER